MVRKRPTDLPGGSESSESQQTGGGRAGAQRPPMQQQPQHPGGYQGGGRGRGSQRGGRGDVGGGISRQQYYGGPPEIQQGRGGHHQQQAGRRGGRGPGTPAGGPSRPPNPELHQATHAPYQTAVTPEAVPYGRPGPSSTMWSRPPALELHQHVQSPHQSDVTIQPVPYGSSTESYSEAGSSSQPPEPTPSEVTGKLQQLVIEPEAAPSEGMQPASSKSMRFPRRPGKGSYGTKCIVKANHFFVELPDKDLHQYDVGYSMLLHLLKFVDYLTSLVLVLYAIGNNYT